MEYSTFEEYALLNASLFDKGSQVEKWTFADATDRNKDLIFLNGIRFFGYIDNDKGERNIALNFGGGCTCIFPEMQAVAILEKIKEGYDEYNSQ
jgi:hypothetical protein